MCSLCLAADMPWKWHGGAADGKRGSKRDDDSEVLKLIKAQTKEMREYKKEVEKQFKEIGGKPAFAGSKQSAAGPLDKNGKKFWCCPGCGYAENFVSRQACRECAAPRGGTVASPARAGAPAKPAPPKVAAASATPAAAAPELPPGLREEAASMDTETVPVETRIVRLETELKVMRLGSMPESKALAASCEQALKLAREEQRLARPLPARFQAATDKANKFKLQQVELAGKTKALQEQQEVAARQEAEGRVAALQEKESLGWL